jgi:hypothetical protein
MDRFNPRLMQASLIVLGAIAFGFPACAAAVAIDDAKATDSSDDDFWRHYAANEHCPSAGGCDQRTTYRQKSVSL